MKRDATMPSPRGVPGGHRRQSDLVVFWSAVAFLTHGEVGKGPRYHNALDDVFQGTMFELVDGPEGERRRAWAAP